MNENIKNKIISNILDVSIKIRGVDDYCKELGVSPGGDVYYASLKAYKKALSDILEYIKECSS
jgi:hypothetical protein